MGHPAWRFRRRLEEPVRQPWRLSQEVRCVPSGPGLGRQTRRVGGGSGVNGIRRRRIRSAFTGRFRQGSTCPCPGQRPSRVPWMIVRARSFPLVLARTWHAAWMLPATRASRSVSPRRQLIGRMPVPRPGWLLLLFHSGRRGRRVQRMPLPETGNPHTTQVG